MTKYNVTFWYSTHDRDYEELTIIYSDQKSLTERLQSVNRVNLVTTTKVFGESKKRYTTINLAYVQRFSVEEASYPKEEVHEIVKFY